jgi:hypothetical protein
MALILTMLVGGIAYFGGDGTFASFTAQVSNTGNSLGSGTLTMNDTVGANTCSSLSATSINNNNNNCNALFSATNLQPGSFKSQSITVSNTGSLNASKLYVQAASTNSTLSSTASIAVGTNSYSLSVNPLEGSIKSGDTIILSYGSHTTGSSAGTYICTATSAVAPTTTAAATSIPVSCIIPSGDAFSYPANTIVTDTSSNTSGNNNHDCYDVETTSGATAGSTYGSELNFVSNSGNPLCGSAILFIQEQDNGFNYCWAGNGVGTSLCTTPTASTLAPSLSTSGAITSLAVAALTTAVTSGDSLTVTSTGLTTTAATTTLPLGGGGLSGTVTNGDSITISSGNFSQTFTASAGASNGATSISVTSATPNFAYPTGATITDTTHAATATLGTFTQNFTASATAAIGATSVSVTSATPNFAYPTGSTVTDNTHAGSTTLAPAVSASTSLTGSNGAFVLPVAALTGNVATGDTITLTSGSNTETLTAEANAYIGATSITVAATTTISSSLSTGGPITSLPVSALSTAVSSGDSIKVTSGSNSQTFTASASAAVGATAISISSATPNFAYPSNSTVTDLTTLTPNFAYPATSTTVVDTTASNTMNSDTTDTISNFDTLHGSAGQIQLYPLTGNGTVNNLAATELANASSTTAASRTFVVGVYVPNAPGTNQNNIQGLQSTFGITWQLSQ